MKKSEKIVGILGGMGPFATVDFLKQIFQLTDAKKDWDHLRILIDNNPKIPSRTRAVFNKGKNPGPDIVESINNLAKVGADFVAVPCNSAHYFYSHVSSRIKIPWLNMIEIVSKGLLRNKKNKPLILGGLVTINKKLYSKYLDGAVYPTNSQTKTVIDAIEEIKITSNLKAKNIIRILNIIQSWRSSIDCVLLACSELPIVFKNKTVKGIAVVNANLEYAKEIIERSGAKVYDSK